MGNACYHVARAPNEWLSAYLNTLIYAVLFSLEAISHKLALHFHRLFYPCGFLSLGINHAMLMRPNEAETAVHGC